MKMEKKQYKISKEAFKKANIELIEGTSVSFKVGKDDKQINAVITSIEGDNVIVTAT